MGGVTAVMLGGSRARGEELPGSDVDLGLYYRPPLDVAGLRELAAEIASARTGIDTPELTEPRAWGPWVDGGGWLTIDDVAVDWIYRDMDRVHRSWETAEAGSVTLPLPGRSSAWVYRTSRTRARSPWVCCWPI